MRNILLLLILLLFAPTGIYGNNAGTAAGTTIDSASELFNEISEKYTSDMPDPEMHECAASYLRLCDMYYRCGYYSNAFIAASTALRIAEERGFNDLLAPIYNNLGKIYCTWHDFSLGTKYFIKGLSFASPGNDPDTYRALIINIQGVYLNMNRPGEAKPYYRKLQEDVPRNSTVEYFLTLNRGLFLLADGDSAAARECFNDAADIASDNDFDPSMLCSTYEYIGDTFNGRDSSLFYWRKAVEFPGIPAYLRLGLLKKLHDTLRRRGDLGTATRYGDMYMSLSDSLFETGEINRVKDFQLSYENEKRMRRINELDADKRERDIRLANQRRLIMLTFGALLVFLTMTVILYIQRHRLRQAYLDLFRRNKETIDTQLGFELREKELRKEIAELRNQIETAEASANDAADKAKATDSADNIVNDAADNSSHEHRSQSVHNLTEAKRESILTAIEKALADESLICRTDFSIDMLAEITGHNTRYVSHILNGRYGCNFRTLLNNLRMDIARRRIIDVGNYGHLTIQAIAESLGYKSNSGFVQLFRKYTGVTPSMFQKMAREEQSQQTIQPYTATTPNFSEKHQ